MDFLFSLLVNLIAAGLVALLPLIYPWLRKDYRKKFVRAFQRQGDMAFVSYVLSYIYQLNWAGYYRTQKLYRHWVVVAISLPFSLLGEAIFILSMHIFRDAQGGFTLMGALLPLPASIVFGIVTYYIARRYSVRMRNAMLEVRIVNFLEGITKRERDWIIKHWESTEDEGAPLGFPVPPRKTIGRMF